ncbi:MAG: apolipoprotein N-acyltransferase [Opitutales bacterium]
MRFARNTSILWGAAAGLLSALFWVLALPPFTFAEAAYIAFVPLLLWLYTRPRAIECLIVGFLTGWASWFVILVWLRHVTWGGTFALSAVLGLIFVCWLVAARWALPRLEDRTFMVRALGFAGLAGGWVLLEWLRGWVLWGGFAWAPLALSQWERPVTLQVAAWTGAFGVSFLLVFFNCCVAQTLRHRIATKAPRMWYAWFSPDLYAALGLLAATVVLFFRVLPAPNQAEPLFTAGVVQPYIPAQLKWDEARARKNLAVLERQTRFVGELENDVILWPETATPWPIIGEPAMRRKIEAWSDEIGKPILMGNLAFDHNTERWTNGAFLVEPGSGLSEDDYSKRNLVPFGEYVPAPFGFLQTVIPSMGNMEAGRRPDLIQLRIEEAGSIAVGPLICYEDVFPRLARSTARAGADVLFVTTNNAWYGEEGGAEQHAAHSVLRAVENRRPVMRCGNGGWSGWIDAYGSVRSVLRDEKGSVFFRGGGNFTVSRFPYWRDRQSFYTRRGDWFAGASAGLAVLALLVLVKPVAVTRHCSGKTVNPTIRR